MKGIVGERWVDVPGYEGIYMASSYGRIKVLPRKARAGIINNPIITKKERILRQTIVGRGYYYVGLTKNGFQKTRTVHSIVFEAFYGFSGNRDMQIDHIDGNKLNNRLDNLQLLSRRDNTSKSVKKKNKPTGAFKNGAGWTARISVNNKLKNLGTFPTSDEAHRAYLKYKQKIELYG